MIYRPDGWNTKVILDAIIAKSNRSWLLHGHEEFFIEAGADAMLEELFRMAKESPTGKFVIDSTTHTAFSLDEGATP